MQVLICRLIDRPLRPTMLKGFNHETQILSWVKSLVIPPEAFLISSLLLSLYIVSVCIIWKSDACVLWPFKQWSD